MSSILHNRSPFSISHPSIQPHRAETQPLSTHPSSTPEKLEENDLQTGNPLPRISKDLDTAETLCDIIYAKPTGLEMTDSLLDLRRRDNLPVSVAFSFPSSNKTTHI